MVELANLRGARIIGPNCLGIIAPGVGKMGGIGGPAKDAAKAYEPGSIGVMSRSGGMTTEISSTLTAAGLGVSTAVSIGGDAIIGSTYAELMPLYEEDEQTEAIVIYTEPGGRMEAELVDWREESRSELPIVAFMAGKFMDEEEMKGNELRPRGDDRRGRGGLRDPEDRPARGGRDPGGRADRRDPGRGQGEARGEGLMARTEELQGIFIDVEVSDEIRGDAEMAAKLEEVCPVDIYANDDGKVTVVRENLDECVLCNLCVDGGAARRGRGQKLYDGTELRR